MEEVDKIIIHSLRQIGCDLEVDSFSLTNFTPSLLVHCVANCLKEIKPQNTFPRSLPENVAQRFTIATTLAEACTACGYRSDIGYQTFLYPNTVEVRRLFMFLIEQLPKENSLQSMPVSVKPIGEYEIIRQEINQKILKQLKMPWVPQFCRSIGNKHLHGCSSLNMKFKPQLNLNIPGTRTDSVEVRNYFEQQAPNIFQQMSAGEFDLISSVLHKNAIDLYNKEDECRDFDYKLNFTSMQLNLVPNSANITTVPQAEDDATTVSVAKVTALEKVTKEVNQLKLRNDTLLAERKTSSLKLNTLKAQQTHIQVILDKLRNDLKICERTCVILENSKDNIDKLETLIKTSKDKRITLEQQWQEYRKPMLQKINELNNTKQAKNVQNAIDLRATILLLEQLLRDKSQQYSQLNGELKKSNNSNATRKEYTRRIHEFIGSIRKQRNDIFKVLDDTRDLQKQLNSVSAQLQRQFNYTDDLLFQSAKHDVHAKRAYKLLAALHATCNELIELVAQTGSTAKEIRDLEEQIDREHSKNIAQSLQQITSDIKNFEVVIKNIQAEIRKVENEIISA